MPMSCEQIDEQMIDFLYGELSSDARAAFEAHLPGCDRCRREVAAFGQTRALARAGLDEAPPAHLRARIVAAARAALPAAAAAGAAGAAAAAAAPLNPNQPAKLVPARPPKGTSFWDRMRAWWALPTLATVGALAVFLLASRDILDVPGIHRRADPASSSPEAASDRVAMKGEPRIIVGEVPPAAMPSADELAGNIREPEAAAPAPDERRRSPALRTLSSGPARPRAKRSAAAPAGSSVAGNAADRDLGGLGRGAATSGGGAVAERRVAKKAFHDDPLDGLKSEEKSERGGYAPPPPPAAPASAPAPVVAAKERRSLDDLLSGQLRSGSNQPRAAAPAPVRVAAAPREPSQDSEVSREGGAAAPEPAARPHRATSLASDDQSDRAFAPVPRPKPGAAAGKGYSAPAPAAAAAEPPAPPPAPQLASRERSQSKAEKSPSKDKDAKSDAPRAETLVQRADRLFTEGRWVEAAVAYRDLLRQQPSSPDAPRWRRRLTAAESAIKANAP